MAYQNKWKQVDATFTARESTCASVTINRQFVPQAGNAKYLGTKTNLEEAYIYQTQTIRTSTQQDVC